MIPISDYTKKMGKRKTSRHAPLKNSDVAYTKIITETLQRWKEWAVGNFFQKQERNITKIAHIPETTWDQMKSIENEEETTTYMIINDVDK